MTRIAYNDLPTVENPGARIVAEGQLSVIVIA
jgi:hypothetical protein